jgi:hypothetical protein
MVKAIPPDRGGGLKNPPVKIGVFVTRRQIVNEIIANWSNSQYLKLHAGEMTAQEVRTVRAVLKVVGQQITESLPGIDNEE